MYVWTPARQPHGTCLCKDEQFVFQKVLYSKWRAWKCLEEWKKTGGRVSNGIIALLFWIFFSIFDISYCKCPTPPFTACHVCTESYEVFS